MTARASGLLRATCLAICASASTTHAHDGPRVGARAHVSASVYRIASAPESQAARDLVRQALDLVRRGSSLLPGDFHHSCERTLAIDVTAAPDPARDDGEGRRRAVLALASQALARRDLYDSALALLERAVALTPRDPDVAYVRAQVLAQWEEPASPPACDVRRKDAEAAQALRALIALDPSYEATRLAFDLGVVLTRLRDFEAAARAYADAIDLAWSETSSVVARANLAEVTMLAGDARAALPHYRRAIAGASGGQDYALAQLGLAVALDRVGEHAQALEEAGKAIDAQRGTLAVLEADGVFFEPPYEREYYRALGFETLAVRSPAERASLLERARAAYAAFVEGAARDQRDARAAQASLAGVVRALATLPRPRKLDALQRSGGRGKPVTSSGGAR